MHSTGARLHWRTTEELSYGTRYGLLVTAGTEGVSLCLVIFHCTPWLEEELRGTDTSVLLSQCEKNTARVWLLQMQGPSSTPCSECIKSAHLGGCQRLHFHITLLCGLPVSSYSAFAKCLQNQLQQILQVTVLPLPPLQPQDLPWEDSCVCWVPKILGKKLVSNQ